MKTKRDKTPNIDAQHIHYPSVEHGLIAVCAPGFDVLPVLLNIRLVYLGRPVACSECKQFLRLSNKLHRKSAAD